MLFSLNATFSSAEQWRSTTFNWYSSGIASTLQEKGSRMKLNNSFFPLKLWNRLLNSLCKVSQDSRYPEKSHWSLWKSWHVSKWIRFPDCRCDWKSCSFNWKACNSWNLSKIKWSVHWRRWFRVFKWPVMSVRKAKSDSYVLSSNPSVSLPFSVRNWRISERSSANLFKTFPLLNHRTSVW